MLFFRDTCKFYLQHHSAHGPSNTRGSSSFSATSGTYPGLQELQIYFNSLNRTGSMSRPSVYAGRKRSRPHLKLKSDPGDGGGQERNSSKRHRDKLNVELEQLAALLPLPAQLSSRLDKLSVMRLTVSYLRIKTTLGGRSPPVPVSSPLFVLIQLRFLTADSRGAYCFEDSGLNPTSAAFTLQWY
ncbi:aryl hydrocarbon receptor-like [Arapaima gigas]